MHRPSHTGRGRRKLLVVTAALCIAMFTSVLPAQAAPSNPSPSQWTWVRAGAGSPAPLQWTWV